jgi:integrase
LNVSHLQQREDHWAIVDLIGKSSHIRTLPVPDWVKDLVDDWLQSAGISNGRIFRRATGAGTVWGSGLTEKVVWHVVRQHARKAGIDNLAPTISRELAPGSAIRPAVNSTDSVSTWTCVGADNGTIPSLQTASRRMGDQLDTILEKGQSLL